MTSLRIPGLLLATLLLGACGQGENNVESGNRLGILHYGMGAEPQSLDPHVLTANNDYKIALALYEALVTRNPYTNEFEPGGASSWSFSEDRKTITFALNRKARWSNGEPVTAKDWVWSFYRSLHPKMGNQVAYQLFPIAGAEAFASGKDPDFSHVGIDAPDDYTLRIHLGNPTPYILGVLAANPNFPVHRATVEAHGKFTDRYSGWARPENFVGNGPFVLDEWRIGRYVSVRKNPFYWDADKVKLNGIVFHTVESILSEEKMFRVGQLHYTETVPLSRIPWYRAQPDSPYRQAPLLATYFYMFNTLVTPVDDVRVRKALAMSIDRRALIKDLLKGTGIPSPGITPRDLIPGYDPPQILRYDPEQARALLAEAGYPGGEGWPGAELIYNTSEDHRKVAVAVQQMWKQQLNISVSLANQEWKVYLDTTSKGNFQIARLGWVVGQLDPTGFLEPYLSDSIIMRTGFSDARYDEILKTLAPATTEPAARMALLREAETRLLEQVPIIPFYTQTSKHLIQPSVSGLPTNVLDIPNYKYVSLDPAVPAWQAEE